MYEGSCRQPLSRGTRELLSHRDGTGWILPSAGISEVFGPHLDQGPEHMVWTTAILGYGLLKAAHLYEGMGEGGGPLPGGNWCPADLATSPVAAATGIRRSVCWRGRRR